MKFPSVKPPENKNNNKVWSLCHFKKAKCTLVAPIGLCNTNYSEDSVAVFTRMNVQTQRYLPRWWFKKIHHEWGDWKREKEREGDGKRWRKRVMTHLSQTLWIKSFSQEAHMERMMPLWSTRPEDVCIVRVGTLSCERERSEGDLDTEREGQGGRATPP